jgi:predicted RNase H-like HicB family nuclease
MQPNPGFALSNLPGCDPRTNEVVMNLAYTAVVKQDEDWWFGWIEEVPGVNCQERTREALLESLRITLREAIELNREDAILAAGGDFYEEKIAV